MSLSLHAQTPAATESRTPKRNLWRYLFAICLLVLACSSWAFWSVRANYLALIARLEQVSGDHGIELYWDGSALLKKVRRVAPGIRVPEFLSGFLVDLREVESVIEPGTSVPASMYADLARFRHIEKLHWHDESGSDQIVRLIAQQQKLHELDLGGMSIADEELAHSTLFRYLERLRIDGSASDVLTGKFLLVASEYRQMQWLTLIGLRLTDNVCMKIGQFENMTELDLTGCQLTSVTAAHFKSLKYLQRLNLGNTVIDDEFAPILASFTRLEELDVAGTKMTAAGLCVLKNSHSLKELYTGGMRGSAELLASLEKCQQIWLLDVPWGSDLTDEDISRFEVFKLVDTLSFVDNCISDVGAEKIAKCRHLKSLHIESNRLTLEGIKSLARMPRLEVLRVSGANYRRELVSIVEQSKSLKTLGIQGRDWKRSEWGELRVRLRERAQRD